MQKPKYVRVNYGELQTLLAYTKAAEKHKDLKGLGQLTFDGLISQLNHQNEVNVTPDQLEHMLFLYKECLGLGVAPGHEQAHDNWNSLMKRLQKADPRVYKVADNGEVVFYEFN